MAEAPKPVEEKAEALAAIEPEVVLTGTETPDELKAKLAEERKGRIEERQAREKALEAKKQLTARAHKAEKELKGEEPATPVAPVSTTSSTVDVDERILKSQGMPSELLTHLKKVADLQKVSLIDAQTDPLFTTFKDSYEKKKKSDDAALRGSKGSGGKSVDKTPATPGLSRDEHKAMVESHIRDTA